MEHHAAFEVVPADGGAGLQQAFGRVGFVRVEFGVAFVGGDQEIVAVGQFDHFYQGFPGNHGAAGVAGGAQEQDLAVLPDRFRNRIEVRNKAVACVAGQVDRIGTGQERCAFINLVKRVWADHGCWLAGIYNRLHQGKDSLAGTVNRHHVFCRVQCALGQLEPAAGPVGDGFAQLVQAFGGRVVGEFVQVVGNHLFNKGG